jgi:hypothetical protein
MAWDVEYLAREAKHGMMHLEPWGQHGGSIRQAPQLHMPFVSAFTATRCVMAHNRRVTAGSASLHCHLPALQSSRSCPLTARLPGPGAAERRCPGPLHRRARCLALRHHRCCCLLHTLASAPPPCAAAAPAQPLLRAADRRLDRGRRTLCSAGCAACSILARSKACCISGKCSWNSASGICEQLNAALSERHIALKGSCASQSAQ